MKVLHGKHEYPISISPSVDHPHDVSMLSRADRAWLMSAISRLALEGRLDILNNNQGYEVAEG